MLPRAANEETFASATMFPCLPEPYNLFISRRCQDEKAKKDRLKEKKTLQAPHMRFTFWSISLLLKTERLEMVSLRLSRQNAIRTRR